ncbi:hypothetical protein GCM10018965_009630 [Nonomuraea roseola]
MAERGVGHEPDAELAQQREDLGLDVAGPDYASTNDAESAESTETPD